MNTKSQQNQKRRGEHCNITITAWTLMEGMNLECWWPQVGHTDTWLPHDPPRKAILWVSSNNRDWKSLWLHTRQVSDWKRCERFMIHEKSRNGKRNKFDLQKRNINQINHFLWHSQYIHSFKRRAELQRQQNICTFVTDSTALCAPQRQHKIFHSERSQ